ncbi:MAG TPA: cyclic nucleotide-binding domain-containing protein [Anaerolineae bacterium]|nr:cyclic nucleotide-binding domain-containing protein [Anaerolineae bacterium]HMR65509.1 cyclic nucleotide-binding domain-containing protein [Anaerolineae bacterium]
MSHAFVLEQVDIFEELSIDQLKLIEEICTEKSFNKDEVVFEENSVSREFYIITEGMVDIQIDPDTIGDGTDRYEPKTIATLRRGQSFGEVVIVDPGVRSASAKCSSETCRLLEIKRDAFIALLESDYHMGYLVMRNFAVDLSVKIRQTNLLVREALM